VEPEQVQEWKSHPVTRLLFRWCEEQIELTKDSWVAGKFETSVENARAQGNATAFGEILEINEDILNGILENE
jgi:hypothetical protein